MIFAEGFAGGTKDPGAAAHRAAGLAVGPDGALYVSDDVRGRIYRIVYRGGPGSANPLPPEGIHPAAGLPLPTGATRETVELGDRIFHGQVAAGTCAGCHGAGGEGTPLGPNLTSGRWLWSKGSLSGIEQTILHGVPNPKEYRSPMPPMGARNSLAPRLRPWRPTFGDWDTKIADRGNLAPGAAIAGAAQTGRRA